MNKELVYSNGNQVTPDEKDAKKNKTFSLTSLGLMGLGATVMGIVTKLKSTDLDDVIETVKDISDKPILIAAAVGMYVYVKCTGGKL